MKSKRNAKQRPRKRLSRYPHLVGMLIGLSITGLIQLLVVLDCFYPLINFEVDAISSVMSTCAEILAGLYGITLTGYIFFSERFQNMPKDDESLYDAVQALTLRYNHMAGYISVLCLFCILLAESIVLYGNNTVFPPVLYRFWVDETLLLCLFAFELILYFVISVLDPQKVTRISNEKKAKLSEDLTEGDPEEFLAVWQQIEDSLYALREEMNRKLRITPGRYEKEKPHLRQTLDALRNYGRINYSLWKKLEKLRQYHNLSLHDVNLSVSKEMCNLAQEVLKDLK